MPPPFCFLLTFVLVELDGKANMSVWTTKSLERDREYIVLQHTLKNVNYTINGIKFRGGYAVVEKGGKVYNILKKIPVLRAAKEFPLIHLRKLPFITRTSDVRMVFGQDVYLKYLEVLNKVLDEEKHERKVIEEKVHIETKKCAYRTVHGELCNNDAIPESPSQHCKRHILEEPKLEELGIDVPRIIPKKEKHEVRERVVSKLKKIAENGKNNI